MANDATTQIPQGSSEADMGSAHETDFAAVQVAEATPAAPSPSTPADGKVVHVEIPQGGTVVRVPVQAGETVVLPPPFDGHHDLAAKEGNGNLAIKVGDVTVILQGYIEASNDPAHPVTIDGSDGQPVDIATILASTDPNLDIQTAAGPAAGAQGADNTGAILAALAGGPGLGGLNAVGVLDQTELQYKLIDNSIRQELEGLLGSGGGPLTLSAIGPQQPLHQSFLHDPIMTLAQLSGHLDFNSFKNGFTVNGQETVPGFDNSWADFDGTEAKPGAANEHAVGTIFVDPSNNTTVEVTLNTTSLEALHLTSDGVALHYELSADGTTVFGFRGDGTTSGDGALVLVVHVGDPTQGAGTTQEFPVDYYLVNRLDDTSNGGTQIDLTVSFDVQTNDDRSATGTITETILDDNPIAASDSYDVKNNDGITVNTAAGVEHNDNFGADGKIGSVLNVAGTGGVVGVEAGDTKATHLGGEGSDVHGQFGTLHLNADGSFTYTRDDTGPTNGDQNDVFTYTIEDDDGDLTSTTLNVHINDHGVIIVPPPPPHTGDDPIQLNSSGTAVFESALSTGSDPASNAENTSGKVTITAPDGIATATITDKDGNDITVATGAKITGEHGTMTITSYDSKTGEIDYSYTLKDAESVSGAGNNIDLSGENFTVKATDTDGDKSSGNITIAIVDDVPTAHADTDRVEYTAGSHTAGNVMTGTPDAGNTDANLQADVSGADGAKLTAVENSAHVAGTQNGNTFTVTGTYGTLVIDNTGHYTYTLNKDMPQGKTDVFTYTITDADGDTSSTTLTIDTVTKPDIKQETPGAHPGEVDVFEAGLANGSNPGDSANHPTSATGTFLIDSHGEGFQSLTVGGQTITLSNNSTVVNIIDDATGTLKVTGVADKGNGAFEITYEYDLKAPIDSTPDGNNGNNVNSLPVVPIVATDTSGDPATSQLTVKIVDDVPTARVDTDTVNTAVSSTTSGNVVTGAGDADSHLQADTLGADGAHITGVSNVKSGSAAEVAGKFTIVGDHGTLVIAEDGTYTYTVTGQALKQGDTDTFTYTLTDKDGDVSSTTLTIDVNCPNIVQHDPSAHPGEVDVYEAGLPGGSGDGPTNVSATGTFTIDSHSEGFSSLMVGGKAVDLTGNGPVTIQDDATGKMVITGVHNDGNGAYTLTYQYTLKDNIIDNTPGSDGHNAVTLPTYSIVATDKSGDQATSSLTVKVVDDIPISHDSTKSMTTLGGNYNILLTIDLSNSMNDSSGVSNGQGGTYSKLQLEKLAIAELLNTYATQGDVAVHVVWFNDPGSGSAGNTGYGANDGGWMTVSQAINYVNGLIAQGNTNYDVAINEAEKSFDNLNGYIANGTNIAYFFSDGMPNENGGPGSDGTDGISGAQQTAWESFLDTNNVNSYAIGVGGAAVASALTPVAYDGATTPATDPAGNTVVVTDLSQLSSVINGTIPQGATGNLVGDVGGTYGADGPGHINSFSVEGGAAHAFDAAHPTVTVTTNEGTFVLNMLNGEYTYTPKAGVAQDGVNVTFNMIDADGDISATSTLHLVPVNHAPVIDSNGGGDTAAISVAENTKTVTNVHATDQDVGASLSFSISGGADKSLFSIDSKSGQLTFVNAPDFENPQDAGHNNVYDVVVTVTDNVGATDTQSIAVTVTNKTELPVAVDDVVYTTQTDAAKIQDSWILANDKAGDGGAVSFNSITNQTNLNASHSGDTTSLTGLFGNTNTQGENASFDYKITDGKNQSDTGHVSITFESSHTIDQSANTHDVILVGSSANETLKGGSGDDVIVSGGGTDTIDGGKGFDQVVLSGTQTWSAAYTNVEMANLHNGAADKLTINAADVFQQNAGTVGGHDVDLFVTGDTGGTKDSVALNGFQAVGGASVSFTDPGTNTAHTYDLYQGTGAHTGVVVAVEHDLTVTVTP